MAKTAREPFYTLSEEDFGYILAAMQDILEEDDIKKCQAHARLAVYRLEEVEEA